MKRPLVLLAVTALVGVACVASASATTSTYCGGRGKIVILGDSASTGYGTTGYTAEGGNGYQDTAWGWAARLDDRANATVVNLALNGAMVSDFLNDGVGTRPSGAFMPSAVWRVRAEDPDLVIIALGGNEYVQDQDPTSVYQANLDKLTARLLGTGARLMFIHTHHFDWRGVPDPQHTWNQYASVMKAEASGHWYLDLPLYVPSARYDSGLYIKDEYGPGMAVHANDQGHSAYFAAIWGATQC